MRLQAIGYAAATAECCCGSLGKPVKLVKVNQIEFPRMSQGGRESERQSHRRELRGKRMEPIKVRWFNACRPRGEKRYLMAMVRQGLTHGFDCLDGSAFQRIQGMDNMEQTQFLSQKLPLPVMAPIRPAPASGGFAAADKARIVKQFQVNNAMP